LLTFSSSARMSSFKVLDESSVKQALADLRHSQSKTNWVLLGYASNRTDLKLVGSGTGGVDEFRDNLRDEQVMYGVLELVVKGDDYNPVKFVFVPWIGPKVPAGLEKAKAAAHSAAVHDWIKAVGVATACEFQTDKRDDILYETIAQSITRMRPSYHSSSTSSVHRQEMSRSHASGGQKSRLNIVDPPKLEQGLKDVFERRADWAILAYVPGKKDDVDLIETGTGGVESLKKRFPSDHIYFCMVRVETPGNVNDTVKKYVLVTLVGNNVPPLQKARSSGQRQDISDLILRIMPFHGQFQPNDADELTEEAVSKTVNK